MKRKIGTETNDADGDLGGKMKKVDVVVVGREEKEEKKEKMFTLFLIYNAC